MQFQSLENLIHQLQRKEIQIYQTLYDNQAKNKQPLNVKNDNSLKIWKLNQVSVALQPHFLLQVLERSLVDFTATKDSVPHPVLSTTSAFLRVLLALVVELQSNFGIKPNSKIVIHDAFFFKVFAKNIRHLLKSYCLQKNL